MTERQRRRYKKQIRNLRKRRSKRRNALGAAAAVMSCLSGLPAYAQDMPQESKFRFQYYYYEDWQEGERDRITVQSPMAYFNGPVTESTELEMGFVVDAVSGASALFHDTLTGASGRTVEDDRHAGDVTVKQHFERFSVGIGGQYSSEEDYDAQGGKLLGSVWSADKNTIGDFGVSFSHDNVRSANEPDIDERKETTSFLLGGTQVLDRNSLLQTNITFSHDTGYLNDPYKPGDTRFSTRDAFAIMNRYRRYIPSLDAAMHFDYRYYWDSWEIDSHMFEVKWYQPLGEEGLWVLRPRLRYYTQDKAEFYQDDFPSDDPLGSPYTADYRLREFGNITSGLKVIYSVDENLAVQASGDFIYNSSDLRLLSSGSPGIDDLYAVFFSAGFEYKFD